MFDSVFDCIATLEPHAWQSELAARQQPKNCLIRIPTGMGKTLGVLATWLTRRVLEDNREWPTRLVWCLPMRTLVEQTHAEAIKLIAALAGDTRFKLDESQVGVHLLMGGTNESRWYDDPEQPAILIGTQDMLLSRALNRGYGMGRAAWPRAFGLLNSDALWVMDEVQLMGVGLATSSQVQAFWEAEQSLKATITKPRVTWWMSATLQPDWLKSAETEPLLTGLKSELLSVDSADRIGPQWEATKTIERVAGDSANWSELIAERHQNHAADSETGRQTLVVVNTVKQAREIFEKVHKRLAKDRPETTVRLVHSRFRPADRESWVGEFLSRETLGPDVDRIIIATQVVEAGVDISSSCLITELAPWPSLVQRFGRAARYGGSAQIVVLDQEHTDEKKALPYALSELNAARDAVERISGGSIGELEDFEAALSPTELAELYPYNPLHVLLQDEFEELFDTSPDLSGADMDISRYIREGDERDVQVFWRDWQGKLPDVELRPDRRELCSVSIGDAKGWIKSVLGRKEAVLTWDYLDGRWQSLTENELRPGLVILLKPTAGGYRSATGFTGEKPKKNAAVSEVENVSKTCDQTSDESESNEQASSVDVWKTIATHSREAAGVSNELSEVLAIDDRFAGLMNLCLRLHDWGKAHPAFANGTYRVSPDRADLAKAPSGAWRALNQFYDTPTHGKRSGFRHELASGLATLELLRGVNPLHVAILGDHHEMLLACGIEPDTSPSDWQDQEHGLAAELNELSTLDFNLLLYLIVSHHGKVRVSLQASPKDQEFPFDGNFVGEGMPIRGVREGDELPSVVLPNAVHPFQADSSTGKPNLQIATPKLTLSLAPAAMGLSARYGASWSERVHGLIQEFGTFTLSYLEAIVRSADGRASDDSRSPGRDPDPLLHGVELSVGTHAESNQENAGQELESAHV